MRTRVGRHVQNIQNRSSTRAPQSCCKTDLPSSPCADVSCFLHSVGFSKISETRKTRSQNNFRNLQNFVFSVGDKLRTTCRDSTIARVGNNTNRVQVCCAQLDDASYFLVIRFGPKTSECEKKVTVVSTVTGCEVTNCATTLHGFNKHASLRREAVSDSRCVLRCLENFQKFCACSHVSIVRLVQSTIPVSSDLHSHSSPLYHLSGELVSLSSVPIPSIDLNLWNRSRRNAFVPISLGFTSVSTDESKENNMKTFTIDLSVICRSERR